MIHQFWKETKHIYVLSMIAFHLELCKCFLLYGVLNSRLGLRWDRLACIMWYQAWQSHGLADGFWIMSLIMRATVSDIYVLFTVTNNIFYPSWIMDNLGAGGGRRRGATRHSAEDQALDQIAKEVRVFSLLFFFHCFLCKLKYMSTMSCQQCFTVVKLYSTVWVVCHTKSQGSLWSNRVPS